MSTFSRYQAAGSEEVLDFQPLDVEWRHSSFVVTEYLRFLKTPFQNIKARARRQTFRDRGGTFADAPVTSAFASPPDLLASAHPNEGGSKPLPRTIATGFTISLCCAAYNRDGMYVASMLQRVGQEALAAAAIATFFERPFR